MQCMHSRRAFIAPVKAFGVSNMRVSLAVSRTSAVRRDSAGHHVRGAANLDVASQNRHSGSQVAMQTETLLQPQEEHVALKALKVAVLVPVLFSVMWTDPAHAARKSRQAKSAAAQIVELKTAEEQKSPLEQLQAQINNFIHKITNKISHKSDDQAAAAGTGFLAQVPSKISDLQRLLPERLQQLQQPEVRKVLAATVALLVVALVIRSTQGSSSSSNSSKGVAAPAAGSGSDGGSSGSGSGSSGTIRVTVPADAATNSAAAAAPVLATITGNGTGSNVKVSVKVPATAAAATAPAAAVPTKQQQQLQKETAESTAEAKKLLKTMRDSADRISATAAATKQEVKASAAAATAAAEKAKAAADQAKSSLTSRSASPINPQPPKVVKPNITNSPASTPATSQLAGSRPATSQPAGFSSSSSSSSSDRPSSPPPIPNVPDKGAATPALTVIGAGAILFDLMMPLGRLAVASARSAAGLPNNVTNDSDTAASSSSSGGSSSRARTSGASSSPRPSTPKPKPAPAPPAPPAAAAAPPAPPKPSQLSKLAKAAAAAAAAESAALPRSVPTELPPVTLEELEAALRASGKMT